MRISGLLKNTLLDYPGHIACTIFLGRCNLRCPFCHNMEMVESPEHYPEISKEEVLAFLKSRIGKLDGVCITGGEPLLNEDIEDLMKPIKSLGFMIKLDTNGFFPELLQKVIDDKLIDMVAMDIKSGSTNYLTACGIKLNEEAGLPSRIKKSIDIIMNSEVEYEFRTTCVKGLHTKSDFEEIKKIIKGAKSYYLQNYKASNDELKKLDFQSFTREELTEFLNIVKPNVDYVSIRGVD